MLTSESLSTNHACTSRSSSDWISFTASAPNFPFPSASLRPGTPAWLRRRLALQPAKHRPPEFAGPSRPWWISRVTRVGDAWWKGRARILFLGPPSPPHTFVDTRVRASMRRTASQRARNTMWGTEQRKAAATTPQSRFPSRPCGRYIYRRFTRQ